MKHWLFALLEFFSNLNESDRFGKQSSTKSFVFFWPIAKKMKGRVDQRPLHINVVEESTQIFKHLKHKSCSWHFRYSNFLRKREKEKCSCHLMSWNPPKLQVKSIKIYSNSKKTNRTSPRISNSNCIPVNKLVRNNFETKEIWIYFWILEQLSEQLETELSNYLIL